ncbi:MAG: hypothetical protein IPJ61_18405 [Tessaracoccus sp.]|uniref:hypothetical protein n=1 Tax=Tessaracoccus sp. TaxID=1971211 RepID=UPI001EB4DBAA|nr:hypothetical protein [Tessaracoccus sp.]MBK7822957.1 hypothetical protein [Tessaracoccus sp.]
MMNTDPYVTDADRDRFLADLTELSRKHGIIIGGCGCCSSPYLLRVDRKDPERSPESRYASPTKYSWCEFEWLEVDA